MISKKVKYTDYDGNEREETFWFNITEAEAMELEMSTNGGLIKMLNKLIETQDFKTIVATMKDIVLKAYGEKSPDGRYFYKEDPATGRPLADKFKQTEAYSIIFMELSTDEKKAAEFVTGILPKEKKQAEPRQLPPGV